MTTPLERFTAERARRAENRKHIGEPGRCARCGDQCGWWTKCTPCRLKSYEEDARYGSPAGEHWPTLAAKPLPDLIDETPTLYKEFAEQKSVVVPWEP